MSQHAAEHYAEQFDIPVEQLSETAQPATLMPEGADGLDVHTFKSGSDHTMMAADAAVGHLQQTVDVTKFAMMGADVFDEGTLKHEFTGESDIRREKLAAALGSVLFSGIKTGKIQSITMELVTPDELPDNVINRLSKPVGRPVDARTFPQYDSAHRILARVKTGGYVGNLALGVAIRPQVSNVNNGFHQSPMLQQRLVFAPYPKKELSALSLRDAGIASAYRNEVVDKINASTTGHRRS